MPLARPKPGSLPISTFLAQRAPLPKAIAATTGAKQDGKDGAAASSTATTAEPKLPLSTRLLKKASALWVGLGKPAQKSFLDWKKRTYVLGERVMDRIEYEEWALKGVDPALGPSLSVKEVQRRKEEIAEELKGDSDGGDGPKRDQHVSLPHLARSRCAIAARTWPFKSTRGRSACPTPSAVIQFSLPLFLGLK